ncbi:MAG: DNA primase [Candidatus Babeliales bacterium]
MNIFHVIKKNLSILTVIQEYTHLKKAGVYWKGQCPLHHEKTPSFTVSPFKEIFYCFGCNTGGDLIHFITCKEHCSPLEAAHFLAKRYNIALPETHSSAHESTEKESYEKVCLFFTRWCQHQLKLKSPVQEYLRKRHINEKTVSYFSLGYCPGGTAALQQLITSAQKHSILLNDLIQAHLIFKTKNSFYSPFEERIIFPIKNQFGQFCGFGGRIYLENDTRVKYYNSKESTFFSKKNLLFGFHHAKKEMAKQETVFLVEGYTDCIAMVQHGYHHCIATLGTACTQEHLQLLARYIKKIYIVYDGDQAGKNAVLRLTELCWQVSIDLYVIELPDNEDPASFLANNASIDTLIENAHSIFHYFIRKKGVNFVNKTLKEKLTVIKDIIRLILRIEDELKQALLLEEVATILSISLDTLKQGLRSEKLSSSPSLSLQKTTHATPSKAALVSPLELATFAVIMNNIELFDAKAYTYIIDCLQPSFHSVLTQLHDKKITTPELTFDLFFDGLTESDKNHVSMLLLKYEEKITSEDYHRLVAYYKKKYWKKRIEIMSEQIKQAQQAGNQDTVGQLIDHFLVMKNKMLTDDDR